MIVVTDRLLHVFAKNEAVELDVSGPKPRLTISPLASLDEPDSLKRLSKMISDLLPPVDLTELLLEINAHTGFADEFFHASEASARVDDLPVSISAALMALKLAISVWETTDRSNVPALTRHRLNWTKSEPSAAETITSANARLVDFQATLPLAQIWVEESGICRWNALCWPVRTINAGPNRKYLVITEGSPYNFCVRSVFRPWHRYTGTLRDPIFVLEGLGTEGIGLNPNEIMTDTAGCQERFWPFLAAGIPVFPRPADAGAWFSANGPSDADYGC